jgi:Na+-driven multidrug efflux pump
VAFPLLAELLLGVGVGLAATLLASRVSDTSAAALGLTGHLTTLLFILFRVIGAGVSVVVAQGLGGTTDAGPASRAAQAVARASLGASTWAGLLIALATVLCAQPLLRLMNAPADVFALALPLLFWLAPAMLLDAWNAALASVTRAHLHGQAALRVIVIVHAVHLGGAALLMLGTPALPGTALQVPALGLTGFAIALLVSRVLGVALHLWVWRSTLDLRPSWRDWWALPWKGGPADAAFASANGPPGQADKAQPAARMSIRARGATQDAGPAGQFPEGCGQKGHPLRCACSAGAQPASASRLVDAPFDPQRISQKQRRQALVGVLRIGIPAAAENVLYRVCFMVSVAVAGQLGAQGLAAQAYVLQINYLTLMAGLSIGLAAEIVVGHLAGAGRLHVADRLVRRALARALLLSALIAGSAALLAPWLIRLFTQDEAIIALAVKLLAISVLLELGRSFNLVVINALRGVGDVKFPFAAGAASMLIVLAGASWWLGAGPTAGAGGLLQPLGWGLVGVWLAYAADEWVRGLIMWARWRSRAWVPLAHAARRRARRAAQPD